MASCSWRGALGNDAGARPSQPLITTTVTPGCDRTAGQVGDRSQRAGAHLIWRTGSKVVGNRLNFGVAIGADAPGIGVLLDAGQSGRRVIRGANSRGLSKVFVEAMAAARGELTHRVRPSYRVPWPSPDKMAANRRRVANRLPRSPATRGLPPGPMTTVR